MTHNEWIKGGVPIYWVSTEYVTAGGVWSNATRFDGSSSSCIFLRPAVTEADVAISAVPGVYFTQEQLDALMLYPDKEPGAPIVEHHRVKDLKDAVKARLDADAAEVAQAHAALPHVKRRRRLAHDRDQLIVWPYWWTNFRLTEAVPDKYEDTQELFMVNWEVLNGLAWGLTKRAGYRYTRKMVVTYEDPPRTGFTWYHGTPENPYSYEESDPVVFPHGFYKKSKKNLQQGHYYVTATRSRNDITKQQRADIRRDSRGVAQEVRPAMPWRFWRFWFNHDEPYILGNDPPRGLEDAISTDPFDAQRYSREWLGQYLTPNHIPMYRYLWAILEQATNNEDGFRALITRMILPSTDAALVPIRTFTKDVLAFIWRQCQDALDFLKTIVWNERYDPRGDFDNVPDNYAQLRAQSIALREKENKGKEWTPANDALWEQLDPFFNQIRETMNAVAGEWDFRKYPTGLGSEGDELMDATKNGTERLEM